MIRVETDAVIVSTTDYTPRVGIAEDTAVSIEVKESSVSIDTAEPDRVDVSVLTDVIETIPSGEAYNGPYRITPTQSTQVLDTAGLTAVGNITIDPIPNDYGKITWNGNSIRIT